MTPQDDTLLTVAETAERVRRCRRTVLRRIRTGQLPALQEGRRYLVRTSDLATCQRCKVSDKQALLTFSLRPETIKGMD